MTSKNKIMQISIMICLCTKFDEWCLEFQDLFERRCYICTAVQTDFRKRLLVKYIAQISCN